MRDQGFEGGWIGTENSRQLGLLKLSCLRIHGSELGFGDEDGDGGGSLATLDIERLPDPEKDSPVKTQRKTTSIFEAKMFGPGPKEKPPMVLALNRENTYVTSDAQRERIREFIARKARERKEGIPRLLSARPDLVKKKPVDKTGHLGDPEEEEEEKTKRRRRRRWPLRKEEELTFQSALQRRTSKALQ